MDKDDPYINIAEEAMDSLAQGAAPGAFLVDLLPARMPILFTVLACVSLLL